MATGTFNISTDRNYPLGTTWTTLNANDLTAPGIYFIGQNSTNVPATYVPLEVIARGGFYAQVIYAKDGIYVRNNDGGWQPWKKAVAGNVALITGNDEHIITVTNRYQSFLVQRGAQELTLINCQSGNTLATASVYGTSNITLTAVSQTTFKFKGGSSGSQYNIISAESFAVD